ncbi:hypothetical protein CKK33_06490 [Mucilaginibacter sp. MD40]|uniref:hypothetical protein n=1 Tax=Mucilaginibacter sp. MD40 TaxID=2029590 RepID=UPI000BAC9900|nr:hypothetical protein [Mucilaginibacter sp. MD40]PAW93160.1 hypothetical protein CKK33_06490 [Mucilaginibacter sp. MD40]
MTHNENNNKPVGESRDESFDLAKTALGEARDYEEAMAELAGMAEEARYHINDRREELMQQYECQNYDDLPSEAREELYSKQLDWQYSYGGSGFLAQSLYERFCGEKDAADDTSKNKDADREID